MNKKTFALVTGCTGGVQAIAIALTTFFAPPTVAVAINSAITIGITAVLEICHLFVKVDD